jgi:hypothetical protein
MAFKLSRPLEEIEANTPAIKQGIVQLLMEVTERGRMNEEDDTRSIFKAGLPRWRGGHFDHP